MEMLQSHGAFVLRKKARTFKVGTYSGLKSWLFMEKKHTDTES